MSTEHTYIQSDIASIINDDSTANSDGKTRRKKLSDLFPELQLENDREILHVTASIADHLASTKRFSSVRARGEFLNEFLEDFESERQASRLKSLAGALFSRTNQPNLDDCLQLVLAHLDTELNDLECVEYRYLDSDRDLKQVVSSMRTELRHLAHTKQCDSSLIKDLAEATWWLVENNFVE